MVEYEKMAESIANSVLETFKAIDSSIVVRQPIEKKHHHPYYDFFGSPENNLILSFKLEILGKLYDIYVTVTKYWLDRDNMHPQIGINYFLMPLKGEHVQSTNGVVFLSTNKEYSDIDITFRNMFGDFKIEDDVIEGFKHFYAYCFGRIQMRELL